VTRILSNYLHAAGKLSGAAYRRPGLAKRVAEPVCVAYSRDFDELGSSVFLFLLD
jgi:hypothetical protein